MKYVTLVFILLLKSNILFADACSTLQETFEKEEQAYDVVSRVAIAGNSSYKIIGTFIKKGETLLKQCPKSYSLDRQYTLKRKLAKAKHYQQRFYVFSQSQVSNYARSHPEEIVIYRWGTVKLTP